MHAVVRPVHVRVLLDLLDQTRVELLAGEHLEERLLQVDAARYHVPSRHLASVIQPDPGRATVLRHNAAHRRVQEHAAAGVNERLPQGVRKLVRPAHTDVPIVHLPHQQRERDRQSPAIRGVPGDGGLESQLRLHLVVLEVLVQELVDRHVSQMHAQELRLVSYLPHHQGLSYVD